MTDDFETLRVDRPAEYIEVVTLNRPNAANALNTQMGRDLVAYFEALSLDPGRARCVILTGAGDKCFCAGGDLKERRGMTVETWSAQHLIFERMARAIVNCPVPVIAAVNGAAFGGGCEIAAACDFIFASESARFALTEVTLGIIPGAGGTQTLARAIGTRRAKELILTGRPFSAAEAQEWGLVNEVRPAAELLDATIAVALHIASNAPLAARQAKQAISRGAEMSLSDAMAFEIEAYNRLVSTEDRVEGIEAFNQKRRPVFKGQ
ncbi:enoyl-CoA hydratase/isomerase family protein [Mesorhizobium sp. ANAO-SY3R2]|uniref:enoyl-CoA hydratase/isomerase family protein n=1 Tax=Mesorhizobium sp. ANAO-SY3R2 TaxID=3166644 RepID=UPI003671B6C0